MTLLFKNNIHSNGNKDHIIIHDHEVHSHYFEMNISILKIQYASKKKPLVSKL